MPVHTGKAMPIWKNRFSQVPFKVHSGMMTMAPKDKTGTTSYHLDYNGDKSMHDDAGDAQLNTYRSRTTTGQAISKWHWYEPSGRTNLLQGRSKSKHWSMLKKQMTQKMWDTYLGKGAERKGVEKNPEPPCLRDQSNLCSDCTCDNDAVKLPAIRPEAAVKDYPEHPLQTRQPRGRNYVRAKFFPDRRYWAFPLGSPNTDPKALGVGDSMVFDDPFAIGKPTKFNGLFKKFWY